MKMDPKIALAIFLKIRAYHNKNHAVRDFGLRSLADLASLQTHLFEMASEDKESLLAILNLTEEGVINSFTDNGWKNVKWEEARTTPDLCGCCFVKHPAGFYGTKGENNFKRKVPISCDFWN